MEDRLKMPTKKGKNLKTWIYRYSILQDGKFKEHNIKGWQKALERARLYKENLFTEVKKVEILNIWTGEIVDLQEAEKRAKKALMKPSLVIPHLDTVRT